MLFLLGRTRKVRVVEALEVEVEAAAEEVEGVVVEAVAAALGAAVEGGYALDNNGIIAN